MENTEATGYETDYMPITDIVWGRGFIAPGGEGNVDRIVKGVDLRDKTLLELGSGAGGGTLLLAGKYGARVVGLELEPALVDMSRRYAQEAGLSERAEFRCVEVGAIPVADASFDFFYSSGVICHIEDRAALFTDVLRLLKPGGMLLGYDWFVKSNSDDIRHWLQAAQLQLHTGTPQQYAEIMLDVGFEEVTSEDASSWYQQRAQQELVELEGPLYQKAADITSEATRDMVLKEWRMMNRVLQSGELGSGYFRGRKPG